jgi:hypothetical protein
MSLCSTALSTAHALVQIVCCRLKITLNDRYGHYRRESNEPKRIGCNGICHGAREHETAPLEEGAVSVVNAASDRINDPDGCS